ncbi:MAG TPA: hypothetical protein VLS49_16040 [Usitatibacter sp.]|nr:hypothetical protein [Usitatibacter sp.]
MNRKMIPVALAGALAAAGAIAAHGAERVYRIESDYAHRLPAAPAWNLAAGDAMCRLNVWVDDRARIKLRGDRIEVETDSGRHSYDQGSACTQPLPHHPVDNFRVVVEHGRGSVMEVRSPERRNRYTGTVSVDDPQDGGDTYQLVMAWHNPGVVVGSAPVIAPPVVVADNGTFDDVRACQDRVRAHFLDRNSGGAYLEFDSAPLRESIGSATRDVVRGDAWAHDRNEARPITYRCVIDHGDQRIVSADYDLVPRPRLSSIQ